MPDNYLHTACGGACANAIDFPFTMAFQPVVDVVAKRIYAYEALVRGPNGESAASVLSKINSENLYAFDQACRVKAIENASKLGLDRRLNINFLPNAVYHAEACLQLTLNTARTCSFPMELITFEFTENEKIMDRSHLRDIVETYRRHGFETALDDFGSGYAGLSLLAEFQPDVIKIDRILIDHIDASDARQHIVAAVVSMAAALKLRVVAEGVERIEESLLLQRMGIQLFQGFLFARPVVDRLLTESEVVWN
jgi:EAL domain-containing protein (putative c-di-GMP-specific phosphodiesterase class I)